MPTLDQPATLSFDGLKMDVERHRVVIQGRGRVELTPNEFEILKRLLLARGRVISRDAIIMAVWKETAEAVDSRTVDQHIARLRKNIGWGRIGAVASYGYQLAERR